jgi:hypothetical protein
MVAFAKEGSLDACKVMGDASAVCRPKLPHAFRFAQGGTVVRTLRLGSALRGYTNPAAEPYREALENNGPQH